MTISVLLNNVANLTDTVTAQGVINTNSNTITTAFTTALNTAGDKMNGNLDMNSNHILNLPAPSSAHEPVRLGDVQSGTSISVSLPSLTGVVTSTAGVGTVATTFSGTGNLPVTQLAGGVGAAAGTFWQGNGTWGSIATSGLAAGTGVLITASGTTSTISVSTSVPTSVVNDINVTGTIAGNVLTLGWTGTVSVARGGLGNVDTASAGGILFSNATGFAVSTSATTANQVWLSAVTGTPVLSTSIWPVDCSTNQILVCAANHTWSAAVTATGLIISTSTFNTPTLTTPTISGTTVLVNATMSGNLTFSTGTLGIVGATDTSSGSAGNVGEYISTTIAAVSALTLVNTVASSPMAISLTPGDWDVSVQHAFQNNSAGSQITLLGGSINSTTAFNSVAGAFSQFQYPATTTFASTGNIAFWTGPFRVSIAATATYQDVVLANFAGSVSAWGSMRARRIR